jgi:hypothetical protein
VFLSAKVIIVRPSSFLLEERFTKIYSFALFGSLVHHPTGNTIRIERNYWGSGLLSLDARVSRVQVITSSADGPDDLVGRKFIASLDDRTIPKSKRSIAFGWLQSF